MNEPSRNRLFESAGQLSRNFTLQLLAMGESARDTGREEPSTVDKAAGVLNSFSRFMKSLSS